MRLFSILAIVFFVLALVFLVISIYLFVKNDIRHVYLEYSGKATSEEIRAMRDKRQKDNNNRLAARIYEEQKDVKKPEVIHVETNLTDEIETVPLVDSATLPLIEEVPPIPEYESTQNLDDESDDLLVHYDLPTEPLESISYELPTTQLTDDTTTEIWESEVEESPTVQLMIEDDYATTPLDSMDEYDTQPLEEESNTSVLDELTSVLEDSTTVLENITVTLEDKTDVDNDFVVLDEIMYVHTEETI